MKHAPRARRRLPLRWTWLVAALLSAAARADVPVVPAVTIDDKDLALTGGCTAKVHFDVYDDVDVAYRVRLVIAYGKRVLVQRDHLPQPPTREWKRDRPVDYSLRLAFPYLGAGEGIEPGSPLRIQVAFVDPANGNVVPPIGGSALDGYLVDCGELAAPELVAITEAQQADKVVARAREFKSAHRLADAWDALEYGLRAATQDAFKLKFRDEMAALGALEIAPVDLQEQAIVDERIASEKTRYLRLAAGRFVDQKRYYAALAILEVIGGTLASQADQAVLGALDEAKRAESDADQVRQQLLGNVPDDELATAKKAQKDEPAPALLDRAESLARKGRLTAALFIMRDLRTVEDNRVADQAKARVPELEAQCLAAAPKDELALANRELNHPAFQRLAVVPSHRFLFIGPKNLVTGIPADSRLRFDLAYVFLTDLFGRVPNPDGDRVTVFFKELFDFGGGIGGGKIIDIGNADPEAKATRVDTGLLYHELTHCIDDTAPVFAGFHEGLANLGAAFCFEALDQKSDSLHSFESNLAAFRADYLQRDLEYWKIPNYGPSCGFFLSFVDKYAKTKDGHDWSALRKFFREYRRAPVKDGREPMIARGLAHFLMRAYGSGAFDDLIAYRMPLVPADKAVLAVEFAAFETGNFGPFETGGTLAGHATSPLPRDLMTSRLLDLERHADAASAVQYGREQLGVVHAWKVIGPFFQEGASAQRAVFPPEFEVDFERQYTVRNNICVWAAPQSLPPVTIAPGGWVKLEFPYQDWTASYALANVSVDKAGPALLHLRADDDVEAFVNDERIGAYDGRGWNDSTPLDWRGPRENAADAMLLPVALKAGRNKILLKVFNHAGDAGFTCAVTAPDGRPLEGFADDADLPDPVRPDPSREWRRVFRQDFAGRAGKGHAASFDVAVGRFATKADGLAGDAKDKGVAWRKYTVRPGFPKDSPSNLIWLKPKLTEGVKDFQVALETATAGDQAPKLVLTFEGEGKDDGLSGYNLIVQPWGAQRVKATLERYDQAEIETAPVQFPAQADRKSDVLEVELDGKRFSASFNGVPLFKRVPIRPIADKNRIGIATFGPELKIAAIELRAPASK